MPKVSIVVRTLNEEKHIGNLLSALEKQTYQDYEIIIVDSGSTDKTLEIARKYPAKIVEINSRDFTFGYSLNVGCEVSEGEFLVFVSAHVIPVDEFWLENMINSFSNEEVAMVYGRQMGIPESKFSEQQDFKRLFSKSENNSKAPINYANNANSAIRKELWKKKKFDEYLFGLEDIDWAGSVVENGYVVRYEPKAAIYHIHEETWPQVFNRYRREAIAAVRIGLQSPPQAETNLLYFLFYLTKDLLVSFPNYSKKRIDEILKFRYYQWKASRIGMKQGSGIDFEISKQELFQPIENRSVVITGKMKAEFVELSLPDMKPGDILIKVDYVGVCRTDIEVYEGTLGYYRDNLAEYPIVPGHEFSGTIVRIGSNNKFQERFKVGEKVVVECIHSRGEVSDRKEVGVINQNGAYGQHVVMPGDFVHKIPDSLDLKTAAIAEPVAVVLRALRRIEPRLTTGSKVAVIGAGQIGNLCSQILSIRGHEVSTYDEYDERLKILEGTGSNTYNELDNLDKYDVIIEATGSKLALAEVLKNSRFDGTILLLGFPYGDMEYNFEDFVGNEKVIVGSVGSAKEDFAEAIELLPKLNMEEFTKVVMPLKDFDKAWKIHKSFKYLKILLKP